MNLYLISQTENEDFDTYDALIVCAESEEKARMITPNSEKFQYSIWGSVWCSDPKFVTVEYLGIADEKITREIILSSFNAG